MTYGLKVINASDTAIFDSQEDLGHYYVENVSSPVTTGTELPVGIIMARPSGSFTGNSRIVSMQASAVNSGAGSPPRVFTNEGTLDTLTLKPMTAVSNDSDRPGIPLAGATYGLEAYNSEGPGAGNVTMSTGAGLGLFSILKIGSFGAAGSSSGITQYDIPSSIEADDVYVMLQNSYQFDRFVSLSALNGGNVRLVMNVNYEFNFDTDPKTIGIRNFTDMFNGATGEFITKQVFGVVGETQFMYGYKRG